MMKEVGRWGHALIRAFVRRNQALAHGMTRYWPTFFRSPSYLDELTRRIREDIERLQPRYVAELGGANRPLLARGVSYTFIGVDIDDRPECRASYDQFLVMNVENPLPTPVDMIISTTLLEHVQDNNRAIGSLARSLHPGGRMHHYIPSKWHPYSILLRFVGAAWQKRLIRLLRPEAAGTTGYPAFFDHCSPGQMLKLFRQHGFTDVEIVPFYGAAGYFDFFLPAFLLVRLHERVCTFLEVRALSSGFVISATKAAMTDNPAQGDHARRPQVGWP